MDDFKNEDNIRFLKAVINGNLPLIKTLLNEGVDINYNDNGTALIYAVSVEDINIIKFLLKNGADINETTNKNDDDDLSDDFYDKALSGIDTYNNSSSLNNQSSLMIATRNDNLDIVKFLLKYKPNLHIKDGNETAIVYAVKNNNHDIAKELLNNGANLKDKDNNNKTLYELALDDKMKNIINPLQKGGSKKTSKKITIKGRKYIVRVGPKGGKYILRKNKKVYV